MRVFVRIIKSNDCDQCRLYIPRLLKQGYKFEIYDGDDPKNDTELDQWKVDRFPVIQIVSEHNNQYTVEHQYPPGTILAPRFIDIKKEQIERTLLNKGV